MVPNTTAGRRPEDAPQLPEALAKTVVAPPPPPMDVEAPLDAGASEEAAETETALVAMEGRSAADAAHAVTRLGVTFRPPDVWRERQPSLAEEWAFVMAGEHLPARGPWRAAARGYAAPAITLIAVLHIASWILRSPARHATAWIVLLAGLAAVYGT